MNPDEPIYNPGGVIGNPHGLPPEQVRITQLRAEPWPDSKRIRAHLQLTPFQKQPNLDFALKDPQGITVASSIILEAMQPKLVLTMHLREPQPGGEYTLLARLGYDELGIIHEMETRFILPFPQADHE